MPHDDEEASMRTGAPVEIIEVEPVWLPAGEPAPAPSAPPTTPVEPATTPADAVAAW
jgi:hypothetical protein